MWSWEDLLLKPPTPQVVGDRTGFGYTERLCW